MMEMVSVRGSAAMLESKAVFVVSDEPVELVESAVLVELRLCMFSSTAELSEL